MVFVRRLVPGCRRIIPPLNELRVISLEEESEELTPYPLADLLSDSGQHLAEEFDQRGFRELVELVFR